MHPWNITNKGGLLFISDTCNINTEIGRIIHGKCVRAIGMMKGMEGKTEG
jgi:hypothetical protein